MHSAQKSPLSSAIAKHQMLIQESLLEPCSAGKIEPLDVGRPGQLLPDPVLSTVSIAVPFRQDPGIAHPACRIVGKRIPQPGPNQCLTETVGSVGEAGLNVEPPAEATGLLSLATDFPFHHQHQPEAGVLERFAVGHPDRGREYSQQNGQYQQPQPARRLCQLFHGPGR